MKYSELLGDTAALKRGDKLVELFIQGLNELRKYGPSEVALFHDYDDDLEALIEQAAERDMVEVEYARFGKSVIDIRRKQREIEAWEKRDEIGSEEWHAAFQPTHAFLAEYTGKPLLAEETRKNGTDIIGLSLRHGRRPRRIGGFIIPRVIGNAQLDIASRPTSNRPIARLQVFNRLKADTYGSHLKIAIAD